MWNRCRWKDGEDDGIGEKIKGKIVLILGRNDLGCLGKDKRKEMEKKKDQWEGMTL